jgi:hypothetical protein
MLDIENIFKYHPANPTTGPMFDKNRSKCFEMAKHIMTLPESAERTLAIRRLQECMFYMNAAVALNIKE